MCKYFIKCVSKGSSSTRGALWSDTTTFGLNKQIFYMLMPTTWFKVEEFRLEHMIRVASSSLVSFCHLSISWVADLYPISIYIIFLQNHISYRSLSSLCLLQVSSLGVFRGDVYDIFRNGDEGTWQKHQEWYST